MVENKAHDNQEGNLVLTVTHPPITPPICLVDNSGTQAKGTDKLDPKRIRIRRPSGMASLCSLYCKIEAMTASMMTSLLHLEFASTHFYILIDYTIALQFFLSW